MKLSFHVPIIYKLLFLLVFMLSGFSILGYLSYDNMKQMKKNLDLVYFGSYVKVVKLKNVNEIYTHEITRTVINTKNGAMKSREAQKRLLQARKEIQNNWDYYKETYKTNDERRYVKGVDKAIKESFVWMSTLGKTFQKGDRKKIESVSVSGLYKRVDNISKLIGELIKYETESAYLRKTEINRNYENTVLQMGLILAIVFFWGVVVSLLIIRNIQKDHRVLEETTQELKFANAILKNISITDPLTGVYNRRYFNVMFDKELKRAFRDKHYISFVMMDIDHFKQYNDTYGHGEGDVALKKTAECMKNLLKRPGDYVFRLGGEEFGLLITESDPEKMLLFARHIGKSVEAMKIEHKKNSASDYVTISMGLVSLKPDSKVESDKIIKLADDALYKAKEGGRNRVVEAKWNG